MERDFNLRNLIDLKEWQKIQDNFSAVTEAGIRIVDEEGSLLISPSGEPKLCTQLLKNSPARDKICGPCLPTFLGGKGIVDKDLKFICTAGLCHFISPLTIVKESKVLGYIIVGPLILVMRKAKGQYRKAAEELNLDLEDFWDALLEIKVASISGTQSLVELIKDVYEYILNSVYQNIMKEEEGMMPDVTKLTRLLDVLLDVAFQVSQADIGSIMFFDRDREELTIRASRGIPEEIVNNTRVKLGDGICGMAVKEGRSFLIDNATRDNRIRSYLTRPYIKSSIVLPIKIQDRTVGVMNLGSLHTSPVNFDLESVQLMNRLIDLATLAIHP